MKRYLTLALILLVAMLAGTEISAQSKSSKPDREEWNAQLKKLRHDYFTKELDLNDAQKTKFFALYDAMASERRVLRRQLRKAEKELEKKGKTATDADYEKVTKLTYEVNGKINEIELKYYEQYKSILTKKQLFKLKQVEEDFHNLIVKYYKEHKDKK